jgi:carbon monoxide dehydrogenase subunit G
MELRGTRTYQASPQAVWDALHNADALKASIPGATFVDWPESNKIVLQVEVGIGPVKGAGWAEARVVESTAPSTMKLEINRQGDHNKVTGALVVDLAPNGTGTQVSYSGSAVLGGPIALLDNPLTRPLVDQALDQFFSRLASQVQ